MFRTCLFLLLCCPTLASAYTVIGYIHGQTAGDQFATATCQVDFNKDGYKDLVVSAPAADPNGLSSGKVYIYYGGPSADTIPDKILTGPTSSFFGQSVSSAGDFNKDGAEDLLVGAPFYDLPATSAGAAYLFYGGTNPDTIPDHQFLGEAGSDYFGIAVSGIGDFNNDGAADIAIGAYRANWGAFTGAGKVYIYYGGVSPDFNLDKTLVGASDGERFGYALTSGDFNGNGVSDIAVGAYSYNGSLINQGRVYVFYGGTGPDSVADLTITGDSAGGQFGWSVAAGKLNNDSYLDLAVGADGFPADTFSAGKVSCFDGGPSIDATPFYTYTLNRNASDFLGNGLASGVDLSGDGKDELLVGMPGANDGALDAGGVLSLKGGQPMAVDTSVFGNMALEEAGKAVGFWSNSGASGAKAMIVCAPSYDNYRGRALLLSTASAGPCCVGTTGNVNTVGIIDVSDLSLLISYLTLSPAPTLPCVGEANVNATGIVDVSDLSLLVSYLTLSPAPALPNCP